MLPKINPLAAIFFSVCMVTGLSGAAEPARKPNILFILVDDYGIMDVGQLLGLASARCPSCREFCGLRMG